MNWLHHTYLAFNQAAAFIEMDVAKIMAQNILKRLENTTPSSVKEYCNKVSANARLTFTIGLLAYPL